ncbi:hypothetical protein BC833DRAFT_578053 [Globomyces pollinis-pini]|nr:hypothetical protein BC833DRAFT_578053 [Globomyces pollinis-pini]KAJ2994803.1 hypothetical protein HDV02_001302 [Globomyces sp. JEL0801]
MQYSTLIALFGTLLAAPSLSNHCFLYHSRDCREFKFIEVPTNEIEKHITIGNESNMPKELVEDFSGVWYMNGNPLADEVLTFANIKATNGGWENLVYDGTFTFDANDNGRLLYNGVRTYGLTYYVTKSSSQAYHVTPKIFTPEYLLNQEITIPSLLANFDIVRTADPNLWLRPSAFFGHDVGTYNFTRIVYGNGTKTSRYNSDYIPNIDSNRKGVTLGKTQLVVVPK